MTQPRGLLARADEVTCLGHVVATRHFPVGDEEVNALAGPGDPHRCIGPPAEEVRVTALRPKLGVFRPGHGEVVELPHGGKEHAFPGEKAEPPVMEI